MATKHRLAPSASSLSESMRDLGYSLATAVADIIDNSITANATEIDIFCDLTIENPTLTIIDNGHGMSAEELLVAMRHGAVNPKQKRPPLDLGRFGLGLKTASFSQCRHLTVASSKDSSICGAEWDLDLVSREDEWFLSILNDEEIDNLPYIERLPTTGTIVIWRMLDRLFEDQFGSKRDEIVNEKLDLVEKHLSLVFHRFISGEVKGRNKITIKINGHPVAAFDPFCRKNKATQILPEEIVRVDGKDVLIQPYILPHHSKLTAAEYDFYEDRSSFISNQGAYIYRNGRLMAWGDWFRLVPKGEATKLARVQIDFPNSLDEEWTIDIKKSRARPPHAVRERLRQIISQITYSSTRVHRGRGKKLFEEISAPVWERTVGLSVTLAQIKRWKAFLAGRKARTLTAEEVRGLFGELTFIRQLIREGFTEKKALESWQGSEGSHQDFIWGNKSVEIKCLSGRERSTVRISSEDQLEAVNDNLFLRVFRLADMSGSEKARSLNDLAREVEGVFSDSEALENFSNKMAKAGYVELHEYDNPKFIVAEEKSYRVTNEFPRLIRSEIPEGVVRVGYEIELESIKPFECNDQEIWGD